MAAAGWFVPGDKTGGFDASSCSTGAVFPAGCNALVACWAKEVAKKARKTISIIIFKLFMVLILLC